MEFNFNMVKKENLHLVLSDGGSLTLRPPRYGSLKKFARLGADVDDQKALELVAEILSENIEKKKFTVQDVDELFDLSDLSAFIELYMKYLDQITNQKKLKLPFLPDAESKEGLPYEIEHYWEQLVSQYLGCPLIEVFNLCSLDFLALKREAFIFEMSKTEEGRKSLTEAKIFEAEDADYQGIIELQKMLGGEG